MDETKKLRASGFLTEIHLAPKGGPRASQKNKVTSQSQHLGSLTSLRPSGDRRTEPAPMNVHNKRQSKGRSALMPRPLCGRLCPAWRDGKWYTGFRIWKIAARLATDPTMASCMTVRSTWATGHGPMSVGTVMWRRAVARASALARNTNSNATGVG